MNKWRYDCNDWPTDCILGIGWIGGLGGNDPYVRPTTIVDGNYDYLTDSVHWEHGARALPKSLYLDCKPDFFDDDQWPWVEPTGTKQTYTLPAKARYDAAN